MTSDALDYRRVFEACDDLEQANMAMHRLLRQRQTKGRQPIGRGYGDGNLSSILPFGCCDPLGCREATTHGAHERAPPACLGDEPAARDPDGTELDERLPPGEDAGNANGGADLRVAAYTGPGLEAELDSECRTTS
jgi:hypothetical protein